MKTMSYTSARNNFKSAMQSVCDDNAPLLITRKNADPVVMISLGDYDAIEETVYLLKSPKNAKRLMTALEDTKQKKYEKHNLIKE